MAGALVQLQHFHAEGGYAAEHYLKARLVTLGVVPPCVLDDFLKEFPGGVIPGWDKSSE